MLRSSARLHRPRQRPLLRLQLLIGNNTNVAHVYNVGTRYPWRRGWLHRPRLGGGDARLRRRAVGATAGGTIAADTLGRPTYLLRTLRPTLACVHDKSVFLTGLALAFFAFLLSQKSKRKCMLGGKNTIRARAEHLAGNISISRARGEAPIGLPD